ncbi:hypothetical protein PR048_014609 [Dryococelus australis]|uniref:Uncharacterized protein n=1 Tax=Dryococelus australis TaxID=614101 RepID=A0ABQ9HEP2_9NEOP|nr:hypothetical protein PR048_014609 [Dryococelus australis]
MQGRGKREIPEKTRRPAASSGTIPTCEKPGGGGDPAGIEPARGGGISWKKNFGMGSEKLEVAATGVYFQNTEVVNRIPAAHAGENTSLASDTQEFNQHLVSYSSIGSNANGERFVSLSSESDSTPVLRASRSKSENEYVHVKGTTKIFRFCVRVYSIAPC